MIINHGIECFNLWLNLRDFKTAGWQKIFKLFFWVNVSKNQVQIKLFSKFFSHSYLVKPGSILSLDSIKRIGNILKLFFLSVFPTYFRCFGNILLYCEMWWYLFMIFDSIDRSKLVLLSLIPKEAFIIWVHLPRWIAIYIGPRKW